MGSRRSWNGSAPCSRSAWSSTTLRSRMQWRDYAILSGSLVLEVVVGHEGQERVRAEGGEALHVAGAHGGVLVVGQRERRERGGGVLEEAAAQIEIVHD